MYIPKRFRLIDTKEKGKSLIAMKNFKKGEIIFKERFILKPLKEASPFAVQIGADTFMDNEKRHLSDYINHSCDPNSKIDLRKFCFVALKDINKGEEINFNYLTTEYDLIEQGCAFTCACDSKKCIGKIKGFRYLNTEQKEAIKPLLSPFLASILEKQNL